MSESTSSDQNWPPPLRTGRVVAGPQTGFTIQLVADPTVAGWHLFLLQPGHQPGMQGYDNWLEGLDDLEEVLRAYELTIEWDDEPQSAPPQ